VITLLGTGRGLAAGARDGTRQHRALAAPPWPAPNDRGARFFAVAIIILQFDTERSLH